MTTLSNFGVPVNLPERSSLVEQLGFRFGDKGTHTSRTIMLQELQLLLSLLPVDSPRETFRLAIVEDNILGKKTSSTRRLTNQRLGELYTLDSSTPIFRVLGKLWNLNPDAQPQLALLCSLARDPILRATAIPVLNLDPGHELSRQAMTDAVREAVGNRLNDEILDKVVRNASASWTQSGHLEGRTRKIRHRVIPTAVSTTYALALGFLSGLRGRKLLQSFWASVLDSNSDQLLGFASEAHRQGLLDMKVSDQVVDISFPKLLTPDERKEQHGTD